MKLKKTASGKYQLTMSKKEGRNIGKQAGYSEDMRAKEHEAFLATKPNPLKGKQVFDQTIQEIKHKGGTLETATYNSDGTFTIRGSFPTAVNVL